MVLDDLEEQMATINECDVSVKPTSERACNRDPCVNPSDFDIVSISSNRVTGSSHWRAGPWGGVSTVTGLGGVCLVAARLGPGGGTVIARMGTRDW